MLPGPVLLGLLAQAPKDLRSKFRPARDVGAISSAAELLRVLRTVWARHRLDRVAMPSTRAEALLRGAIHPSVLSAGERQDLLDVVSIQALNQLAGYLSSRRQEFERLMASLADLPLPATTRDGAVDGDDRTASEWRTPTGTLRVR